MDHDTLLAYAIPDGNTALVKTPEMAYLITYAVSGLLAPAGIDVLAHMTNIWA